MNSRDLAIRTAQPEDLEALCELYTHLNPTDDQPEPQVLHERWSAMLSQPGFSCLVGFTSSQLVSSCCLAIIPNLTRGGRSYALVDNVVTHRDFRRRGFGKAVLHEALSRAWRAECYKVMLLTGSKRPETHRFYESCGFRSDDKTGFVARPEKL